MSSRPTPSPQSMQKESVKAATSDRQQIAERAYYRYVERGRTDGRALDDWLNAEIEIGKQTKSRGE